MIHHVETFFDDAGEWGWEATGFEDIDSAESDADLHTLETS